ncbi:hypothetical protein RND71_039553 [Anisodus tanguticus]|uniref:protein-synthesizing GTPase n=1 Tax=Anisodus tanguticus TaxID=243964 RepID=A0AAE1QZE6_9SOLA|nr:hypothetical protein RND71_039553 [Anisodus tanguticus]
MAQKELMEQDLRKLDVTKLHPLSPEVISRQPTINIGLIGHVAHGKTTLVRAISGIQVAILTLLGHEILMTRMLSGATIMDGALLLIAANESCPQPQTLEHLSAVDILKLQNLIILQNNVDLIKEGQARDQYKAIREFLKGTVAEGAPVVPVSSQLNYNIDAVCKYIGKIPIPKRDFVSPPHMVVVRSFDVNKPGCGIDDMKGGVVGGTITKGVLKVNQMVELRPGIIDKDADGKTICKSIYSRIMSLFAEQNKLHFAVPGGLIGVGTSMDPALSGSDMLVGQVLGNVGTLPEIRKIKLLRRLVGVEKNDSGKQVSNLVKGEVLMLNILSMTTWAKIITVRENCATLQLTAPACTGLDEKVVLSRRVGGHWRLIGWGEIEDGVALDPISLLSLSLWLPPPLIAAPLLNLTIKFLILRQKDEQLSGDLPIVKAELDQVKGYYLRAMNDLELANEESKSLDKEVDQLYNDLQSVYQELKE